MQGYLLSRPLPPDELEAALRQGLRLVPEVPEPSGGGD